MRFKSQPRKGHFMPELVASSDSSRPVLSRVHLNADESVIEVTDSYMLARFPVELDEGDTSGPIPLDALKASRKPPLKHIRGGTSIRCNSHVEVRHAFGEDASEPYVTIPRETSDYTFPNTRQLIPENPAEFQIGLNVAKLAKLAKAMGSDEVRLVFTADRLENGLPNPKRPSNLRPVVVRSLSIVGDDAPVGLLMPIRIP